MKVQLNLLPDVKLAFLKTQRVKRLSITLAAIVIGISVALFMMMLITVEVVNKKKISDLDKDIASKTQELQGKSDASRILTIQNQLQTLSSLHKGKHITSRIFSFLPEVTPVKVSITSLTMDYSQSSLQIRGTADTQHSVNTFVDTLKFTTYQLCDLSGKCTDTGKNAFPSVVESAVSLDKAGATYTIDISFDPAIFANNNTTKDGKPADIGLNVPALTTTRSVLDDPKNALFTGKTPTNNPPNSQPANPPGGQ